MNQAVIVDGVRTSFSKAGSVRDLNAVDLGVLVVRELVEVRRLVNSPEDINMVIGANIGNQILPPDGSNLTRLIALRAGLPVSIPAWTVNINCGSGLHAILNAVEKIELGLADCVLVVAVEVMSDYTAAYSREQRDQFGKVFAASRLKKPWEKFPALVKALLKIKMMPHDPQWLIKLGLTDPYSQLGMDEISDQMANDFHLSRAELDLYALESHRKAARSANKLSQEMIGSSSGSWDNGVRPDQNLAQLAKLKPLNDGGVTTAGNASQVTDGAVALLVTSREFAERRGLPVLANMHSRLSAEAGCEPAKMGLGPVEAIDKLCSREDAPKLHDFALVETNEAFASVVLAQMRSLKDRKHLGQLDPDVVNVNGGAIAIGHPISASGARLVLTCAKELKRRGGRLGLVTLCIGGGQGIAAVIENRE